jgi:hypothetical protein
MYGRNAQLEGGQELTTISRKDFDSGSLLQRIIDAVNSVALNLGAMAVGKLEPPPPINSIQVQGTQTGNVLTAPSEILHWTLSHNGEINKHVNYFTEIDINPNFTQPHVIHHGASRSGFLHLPTQDSNGNTQTYYMRSYPQYLGSDPAKPTVLGGLAGATKIQMTPPTVTSTGTVVVGGTSYPFTSTGPAPSQTTLLSSTGSGTASSQGTQGAKGFGTILTRPAPGPKRSLA